MNLHGANLSLLGLIKGLSERGHECVVILPSRGPLEEALKKEKISYCIWHHENWLSKETRGRWRRLLQNKIAVQGLSDFATSLHFDLIYSNSSCCHIGHLLSQKTGIPHIWHVREFGESDFGLKPDFGREKFQAALKLADQVICVSEDLARELDLGLGESAPKTIYNGVYRREQMQLRPEWPHQEKALVFGICGQMNPAKGHLQGLEAFIKILEKYPDSKLLVAGDVQNAYGQELIQTAQKHRLAESVKFLGYVSDSVAFYHSIDALLVCSEREAMGRVTVEAQAQGAVVIGRNSGGTSELIADAQTGLLYDGTLDTLVKQMELLSQNVEVGRRIRAAAIAVARDKFSVESYSQSVSQIIRKIVQKHRHHSSPEILTPLQPFTLRVPPHLPSRLLQTWNEKLLAFEQFRKRRSRIFHETLEAWRGPWLPKFLKYLYEERFPDPSKLLAKTKSDGFHLLISLYPESDPKRLAELMYCLRKNCENRNISKIWIFFEGNLKQIEKLSSHWVFLSPKIIKKRISQRPNFQFFFDFARQHLSGKQVIVANTDIFFDASLKRLVADPLEGTVVALTRYNLAPYRTVHGRYWTRNEGSQDAWIFKSPLKNFFSEITLGWMGCDNWIAYEMQSAGLRVINPSRSVFCWHVHKTASRNKQSNVPFRAGTYHPQIRLNGGTGAFVKRALLPFSTLEQHQLGAAAQRSSSSKSVTRHFLRRLPLLVLILAISASYFVYLFWADRGLILYMLVLVMTILYSSTRRLLLTELKVARLEKMLSDRVQKTER